MTAPDLTKVLMLDDVDLAIEAPYVVADKPKAVAGYVNGRYANWPAIVQKWEKTVPHLLSIDVQANPSAGAQCLDIEQGNATIGQAPQWTKVTRAAGAAVKDMRWMPKLYISAGSSATLISTMKAAGLVQGVHWLLWSAHYTGNPHICSPAACGYPQADATQYTSTDHGHSLDASMAYGYFFAQPGQPVMNWADAQVLPVLPPVSTKPVTWQLWPASMTLYPGQVGDPVRALQAALRDSGLEGVRGIDVDGNFAVGGQTATAVKNFQHLKGLTEDGIPGPATRAALVALGDEPVAPPAPPVTPPPPPPPPPVTPPPVAPPPPVDPPPVVVPPPPVVKEWTLDVNVSALQLPVAGVLKVDGYADLNLPAGSFIVVQS